MSESDKLFDFIIYHGRCNDGFASVWTAWRYLKDKVKNIKYHAAQPNDKFVPNIENKSVLLVDLTFINKQLMDHIRQKSKKLYIIDHHTQAHDVLKSTDHVNHDESHSAAYLTWKYFFPSKKVPVFIKLIEDSDIKTQKYNKITGYFTTTLKFKYKMDTNDFAKWSNLEEIKCVKELIRTGKSISIYKEDIIRSNLYGEEMRFEKYKVIVHNFAGSELSGDIANMLAAKHNNTTDFAIVWSYEHKKKRYSVKLRSIKTKVDLNKIAMKYGGGGHIKAATFYHKDVHSLLKPL